MTSTSQFFSSQYQDQRPRAWMSDNDLASTIEYRM